MIARRFQSTAPVKALVLGATPELRDLLAAVGAEVTVVDSNDVMVQAMTRLRRTATPETTVVADWLEFLPTTPASFDLILSDFTQGNIEPSDQVRFYECIAHALTPKGLFIDRVVTYREPSKLYAVSRELPLFEELPVNLATLNDMLVRCVFATDMTYEFKRIQMSRSYAFMREWSPTAGRLADMLDRYIASGSLCWHYGEDWQTVSERYYAQLKPVEEIPHLGSSYEGHVYIIATETK